VAILAIAPAAEAHVRVSSEGAALQGGDTVLIFTVPTEEDANTVKLSVSIPADAPIPSVNTMAMPGWTVTTTERVLTTPVNTDDGPVSKAISTITWTANPGGGIPPNGFEEFRVSAGPLPAVTTLAFPTVQTYANGDVVRWIEPTPASGQEPDHPVPVLDLQTDKSPTSLTQNPSVTSQPGSSGDGSADDSTARALGIAGIAVGGLSLLSVIGASYATRRRRTS
jgi:uncharacterized protein YcnI